MEALVLQDLGLFLFVSIMMIVSADKMGQSAVQISSPDNTNT